MLWRCQIYIAFSWNRHSRTISGWRSKQTNWRKKEKKKLTRPREIKIIAHRRHEAHKFSYMWMWVLNIFAIRYRSYFVPTTVNSGEVHCLSCHPPVAMSSLLRTALALSRWWKRFINCNVYTEMHLLFIWQSRKNPSYQTKVNPFLFVVEKYKEKNEVEIEPLFLIWDTSNTLCVDMSSQGSKHSPIFAFVIIASNILNGELFFINIFPGSASNIKEWCGTQSDFVTFFLFSRQTLFLSEYRDIWREHSNITSWLDISSTASQNIETESMQIQKFVFFSCMHLECTAYQLSLSEKSETSIIWLLKHDACQQNEIANYIRHNAN